MKNAISIAAAITVLLTIFLNTYAMAYDNSNIDRLAEEFGINTYSVAFIKGGKAVTYNSNGNTEASSRVFEAASNGKMIAAYLCLRLVDEGKLSLDDQITKYLDSEWITDDPRFSEITVRHLLSHSAGFSPSYETGIDKKIYFKPGSHFCYSGVGYIYLQKVIENVTGQDFESAAQNYVFRPLSMSHSTFKNADTVPPFVKASSLVIYIIVVWAAVTAVLFLIGFLFGLATKFKFYKLKQAFFFAVLLGFVIEIALLAWLLPRFILPAVIFALVGFLILLLTRKKDKLYYLSFIAYILVFSIVGMILPVSFPVGSSFIEKEPNSAYSLKTTTADMTLFAQELLAVSKSDNQTAVKEMFRPQTIVNDANSWGAGIAIEQTGNQTTFWHSGINPGMQSLFVLSPKTDRAVIVMTNSDNGLHFAKKITQEFLEINGKWDIVRTDLSKLSS